MIENSVLRVNRPPVDKVISAIKKCEKIGSCSGCPYEIDPDCQIMLRRDALKVIEWYKASESEAQAIIICADLNKKPDENK